MHIIQNRRRFMAGAAAAGAAGLIGCPTPASGGEPPPETTTVRLGRNVDGPYCWASLYLAGELLRADGMPDVQYVQGDTKVDNTEWLAAGVTDFDFNMPSMHIRSMESGAAIKILAGVHTGCWELRANERVAGIADLKGKRVGIWGFDNHPQIFLSLMINFVGLDTTRDIEWVIGDSPMQDFIEGKVDAYLRVVWQFPTTPTEEMGRTIASNEVDRPWSQYYCCMVAGSTEYVSKYPLATKRVLRAILKSADFCASDPASAARELVDRGFVPSYDLALTTLQNTRHDVWRTYDAEDSVRFYALRMQETGMIKSSPQEIIANGTDWRFLEELKHELKA
jgi:NitT/TauT family transport system substrate-binding protein